MFATWLSAFAIFTATFVTPFAGAATPVTLALPQDINYVDYIFQQLGRLRFSTDLLRAAGPADNPCRRIGPCLLASIEVPNPPQCLTRPLDVDYVITIRNHGQYTASPTIISFTPPLGSFFVSSNFFGPSRPPFQGTTDIPAGGTKTINVRVRLPGSGTTHAVTAQVDIYYGYGGDGGSIPQYFTGTSHLLQSDPSCVPPRPTPTPTPTPTPRPSPSPTTPPSPTAQPSPSPLPTIEPTPTVEPPLVEAFIFNEQVCPKVGDFLTYLLIVHNRSDGLARQLTITNTYPGGTEYHQGSGQRPPDAVGAGQLIWREAQIEPGGIRHYTFRVRVTGPAPGGYTNRLAVGYILENAGPGAPGGHAEAEHTIPANCDNPPFIFAPRPPKVPAIVCDPAQANCQSTFQSLFFGLRYQDVLRGELFGQTPRRPTVCGPDDTRPCANFRPDLGPRFAEAVADIVPGECRVLSDDVVADPAFQDALNRQGAPAAPYLVPLYNSGLDFKRLVQENMLLGIDHLKQARDILRRLHLDAWDKQAANIQKVLGGAMTPAQGKAAIETIFQEWLQQTTAAQLSLRQAYANLQEDRKKKFDPIAQRAIANARLAIKNSCGLTADGNLPALLPPVKAAYLAALDAQTIAYGEQQKKFIDPAVFPALYAWKDELRTAYDAAAQGNIQPLRDFLASIPSREQNVFNDAFRQTYAEQQRADGDADQRVRTANWEVALDAPKTVATNCEKERVFGPPVEATWCESTGADAQFVQQSVVRPEKRPPQPIESDNALIRTEFVKGSPCSRRPGDPYWASDCSCFCDQFVWPPKEGGIVTCQQSGKEITRHDIFVTTQQECLQDIPIRHQEPFF